MVSRMSPLLYAQGEPPATPHWIGVHWAQIQSECFGEYNNTSREASSEVQCPFQGTIIAAAGALFP
jgi:hypothetical protein